MLLAGDVGATKTNLAIFSPERGPRAPLSEASFPSTRYDNLAAVVREFLNQVEQQVECAAPGVAGAVVGGRADITNLGWVVDEAQLQATLGLSSVRLLNDLVATANAVPLLEPSDVHVLNAGEAVPGGAIAVIAPGTGLGEAFLTWDGARYTPHASEGGHTDFGPTSSLELDMLRHLQERFGHVSYERVCSGQGLPNIYAYLKDSHFAPEPPWLAKQLATAEDPTPVIVAAALDGARPCPLCQATLRTFVSVLGAEAGNLVLKVLATGGVYLGGGIPPRILPALEEGAFMDAFRAKGRFAEFMERLPVRVILNPKVALLGAARYGLEM